MSNKLAIWPPNFGGFSMVAAVKRKGGTHQKKTDDRQLEKNVIRRRATAAKKPIDRRRGRVS
jgi:hypothetical protein